MYQLLYAIVATPGQSDFLASLLSSIKGVENSTLAMISSNGLTAIVEKTNRNHLVASPENALAFAKVIEVLSWNYSVLPVRYGTVMKSSESVIELLERCNSKFKETLQRIENKEEFSLKVLWDYEKGSEKIRQQMKSGVAQKNLPFEGNTISKTYLLQKLEEHRFEDALLSYVEQLIAEICNLIEQLNPIHKFKKMVSQNLILDAVFLLEKEKKESFTKIIDQLKNQYSDLHFLLTGPWPPYNFVEPNIK
jgi:hypothetical protein